MPDHLHGIIKFSHKSGYDNVMVKHCKQNTNLNGPEIANNASPLRCHKQHNSSYPIGMKFDSSYIKSYQVIMHFRRNSMRLPGYDYSQPGYYFITICTHSGEHLFGMVENNKMVLNLYGNIIHAKWMDIPKHFKNARVDIFQVMPHHLHGIIILTGNSQPTVGVKHCKQDINPKVFDPANNASPQPQTHKKNRPHGTKPGSISAIMQNFSSVTTRKINKIRKTPGKKIWQRGFYDHIIRTQDALSAVQRYIINNPANWHK